jgi:hypothetical protein
MISTRPGLIPTQSLDGGTWSGAEALLWPISVNGYSKVSSRFAYPVPNAGGKIGQDEGLAFRLANSSPAHISSKEQTL